MLVALADQEIGSVEASLGRQQEEQKAGRETVVRWAEEESAFAVCWRGLLRSPWGLERSEGEEKTSRT